MTRTQNRNEMETLVEEVMIRIDEGDETTLSKFLHVNTDPDVLPLPLEYLRKVVNMEIGERVILDFGAGGQTSIRRTR